MRVSWQHSLLLATAALLPPGNPAAAAEVAAHPVVAGFERFYTGDKTDAAKGGQLLLTELNCISCHEPPDASLTRKQAPILDHVGGRVRVSYLKKFLDDPQAVKPGTTMPNLFAGDADKAAKVEALVHFLASTGAVKQTRPDAKSIALGKDLFGKVGCVACHGPRDEKGHALKSTSAVVPLGDLAAKYSINSLTAFLEKPHEVRPSARMPLLLANNKDARDVATYLLQGIKVDDLAKGGTTYAYYENTFTKLPDFEKLKPNATGNTSAFSLGVAKRNENYALKFEGFFKVERDGDFKFTLHSDDGSKLWVDGQEVVDNDGVHPPAAKSGNVKLTKGVHKVTVGFFQAGGGAELDVQVEGPGLGHQDLAGLVAPTEAALDKQPAPKKEKDDEDALEIQPQLVEKGKVVFAAAGCASCHQMKVDNKPLVTGLKAIALDKLKTDGGCLAVTPAGSVPRYALSDRQRTALAAAIKTPPVVSKEPAEIIARTMTTFNCYACHVRGEVGGVDLEGDLNKSFQTLQPEMGDEGRLPPSLTGVGAKLNPDYFKSILDKGVHDRPYMHTRMPGFGLANVGMLPEAYAAIDKLPEIEEVKFADTPARVKAAGRHLVGAQALGCIKCHTFNGEKAEGVQGIDMTLMPQRVRRDWFHAYLIAPTKLRPGTRMPESWPGGKTFYKDVLEGKTINQIEGIWVYLKEGKAAQQPIGGGKNSIPLVPEESAIIYRNFIQGAGTRAIGVGYPEKAHLAFDANDMRLAMLWQGAFIDAGRHWSGRGEGFQGPLGDNILHLQTGPAFAVLEKAEDAWPTKPSKELGYKFKGYHLSADDRPTFNYTFDDVAIEDFPNAVAGKDPSMKRSLKLTTSKAPEKLYFRAAVGTKIEAAGDGWYKIDGWKMKLEGGGTPQIRQANGKSELLVPVPFKDGKAQINQEFVW